MAQYGVKIVGSIKVKKKSTNSGFSYFTTLLATNKDYKTEEKLYLNCIVNFKDKDIRSTLQDDDIIGIEAKISLSKSNYKDKELDIGVFVEKVLSINGNKTMIGEDDNYDRDYEDDDIPNIKDTNELPF